MDERIIKDASDVAEGAAWLADAEPAFAPLIERLSPLPLRLKSSGFVAVLDIINGQQVSVASANAINARMRAAGFVTPQAVLAAPETALRDVGFSKQKIRYARGLAEADLDFDALHAMPSEQAIKALVALPGIGSWTAQIYVMFSMGRADVFADGDLALQVAIGDVFGTDRPTERETRAIAARWSPWRSVAARLLWAYYAEMTGRRGLV
ncbi:MAG: DNA-3-methyladenine glycosylase 2 family protein [Paracoccaceae bacterium]|jgi:DNA-3-methyladenine glycosylase II|nr:DNA-3-methyladenine glycosylase 2 family protein [Paracoccaceae bacterium]MDG2453640.1 DNA-3-methyladenine glycosylase 2 family protein [Paracoccaceae bacterium]